MIKSHLSRGAALAALLTLAACGGTHQVRVNGEMKETGSQPQIPGMSFQAVCSVPAQMTDFSKEYTAVQPAARKLGERVYAFIPPKRLGSAGCSDALHEAQIEAINRAGLFDHVKAIGNAERGTHPDMPDADYYLWYQGDELVTSYKNGPRFGLPNGPGRLDEWVKTVGRTFDSAREWQESQSNVMQAHIVGPNVYYVINGKEFDSVEALKPYLATRKEALLQGLHKVEPLSASAHLIRAPESAQLEGLRKTEQTQHVLAAVAGPQAMSFVSQPLAANDRNTGLEASDALGAYLAVLGDVKSEALRQSGLFKALDVTREDTTSPAFYGASDVAIWQFRNAPQWSVRAGLGPIHTVIWPAYDKARPDAGADGWVANMRAAVTAALADPQPEGATLLQPGCRLPEYTDTIRKGGKPGTVTLVLDIAADGRVVGSQVATSSGNAAMDAATTEAFSRCRFKGGERDKSGRSKIHFAYIWQFEGAVTALPAAKTIQVQPK